jgi:hypothetical protein
VTNLIEVRHISDWADALAKWDLKVLIIIHGSPLPFLFLCPLYK